MSLDKIQVDRYDGQGDISRDHDDQHLANLMMDVGYRWATWDKPAADGAAATTTPEIPFHLQKSFTAVAKDATFIPNAALVANDTNFATLRVRKRKKDGTDGGILFEGLTTTTGTGNWVAFAPEVLAKKVGTPDTAFTLGDGESLTAEILKGGTGVVVPAGTLRVSVR